MSTSAEAQALGFVTPTGSDYVRDGDDAITVNARRTVDLHRIVKTQADNALASALDAQQRMVTATSAPGSISLGWTGQETTDYVGANVGENVGRETPIRPAMASSVPILDTSGRIPADKMPPPAPLPENVARTDGTKSFSEIKVGQSVRLREVQGARGHRLQYTSRNPGDENARPYMEVNASDADSHGDVTAGYQCHVTGDGATPNNQQRVYWFLEAHGLSNTFNAHPDLEGCFSMGVSRRAVIDERGRARALVIDAGFRPGLAFHYEKPYIELLKNTAFVADDRARPAIFDGAGAHHGANGVGTIHGGDLINLRREGAVGARFTTVSDTPDTAATIFLGRSRGTVPAPQDVQAGDRLGAVQAGTQNVSADYVHVPGGGSDPRNRKHVTTQVASVATEAFTPGTAQGSRVDVEITPAGTATRTVGLSIDAPATTGQTSILVQVNRDGTTSQARVEVGPPDSGGTGYRALRIPN